MMKKTDTFIYALLYTLYMFASCLVAMLFEVLAIKAVNLFVEVPYIGICIIRTVIYAVLTLGIIFVLSFREGYKEASYSFPITAIASVLALIPHFLFSLLFKFASFISGGVRYITALVRYGEDLSDFAQIEALGAGNYTPVFFTVGIVYCAVIILAKHWGCKKRLSDRKDLTDGKIDDNGNYHFEE